MAQRSHAVLNEGDLTVLAEHEPAISERPPVRDLMIVSTIFTALTPMILLLP
jgi:hypothetical protein